MASIGFGAPSLAWLLSIGGAFFACGAAACLGAVAFSRERRSLQLAFGLLGLMALLAVFGGGIYYLYQLDAWSISGLLIALPWLVFAFSPFARPAPRQVFGTNLLPPSKTPPSDSLSALLLVLTVGFDAAALRWLSGAATAEAIRSPWEVVHPIFFLWIFLATATWLALCYRDRFPHFALASGMLHLFTMLAPALIVYKIGFGFDPFIHIATEKLIAAAGAVTPKTPYYLGQYAVVTILSHLTGGPVEWIDRLLLPVMAAVYLPLTAAYLLRRGYKLDRRLTLLSASGVLLVPLASFVVTTPQGLANLFTLAAALLGTAWLHDHRPPLLYVMLLAAAALAIHPLAGIPAGLFTLYLMFFKLREWRHWAVKTAKVVVFLSLFAAAAAVLPAVFTLGIPRSEGGASLSAVLRRPPAELLSLIPVGAPGIPSRFKPALDFAQLVVQNHAFILLILAAFGAAVLWRRPGYRRTVWAVGGIAAALFVSVILLKSGVVYRHVIDYEQQNYGNRLFDIILLLTMPLALAAVAWWWRKLPVIDPGVRLFQVLLFAGAIAALAYAAFPRVDDFQLSRGYSVSVHDVNAVRKVRETAVGPYVVLANQSVSAAALREYGFLKYYGEQFYYSIPTGAPLYRAYLDMVYQGPSREVMTAAMKSAGAPTAYFVINRYWNNSERIVEAAKKTADEWFSIDDGEVYAFRYGLE